MDFYSGVGGWSLGLGLAGIDVVASFEHWGVANETNFKNNGHEAQTVDIRQLSFEHLPTDIDIVVGSPPCTEFSFSNRGGAGNLSDGLEDIITFFKIVDHIKPAYWAMENVPRVAGIIRRELERDGRLRQFRHLDIRAHVVNMEDFGLPQRRRRCIAGNFDFERLVTYTIGAKSLTLGDVVTALASDHVIDPLYGVSIPKDGLTDHVPEQPLNNDEVRINRANKNNHTIYNFMQFPDPLDRAVRTITATCTRVCRESIVVDDSRSPGGIRRLTVRERACLQGFPVTFQFYAPTYRQKLQMVGNAIPPAFTYLLGHAFLGTPMGNVPPLETHSARLARPLSGETSMPPDHFGSIYPKNRNFRFAVPSLRLKSGVRFELRNRISSNVVTWSVEFYFGTSKQIESISLDSTLARALSVVIGAQVHAAVDRTLDTLKSWITRADVQNMQNVWSCRGVGGTSPFGLLDEIDATGTRLVEVFDGHPMTAGRIVRCALELVRQKGGAPLAGTAKLERNASNIAAGLLIGTAVNQLLHEQSRHLRGEVRAQPQLRTPSRATLC